MIFHSLYYGYELINTNYYFLYSIIIYIFLIWNREIASQCLHSIKEKQYNDLQFCLPGEITALREKGYI